MERLCFNLGTPIPKKFPEYIPNVGCSMNKLFLPIITYNIFVYDKNY